MTDKPKLTGQGGPGRGQGRPKGSPNNKPRRVRMSFRLSPVVANWLKGFAAGKRTEIVEEALFRQMDYEDEGIGVEETKDDR